MKRHRSSSVSSQDSEASTSSSTSSTFARSSSSPATKLKRLPPLPGSSSAFTCSLPPTCSTTPAIFSSARDIEAHYSKMHALVCEAELFEGKGIEGGGGDKGKRRARVCGKIFPDRRLMDLHHREFHNPLLAVQLERGERIYECYLPPSICFKTFKKVKSRRLHLIDVHGFPAGYYFPVVKEGIGPLLKAHGPAASLLRDPRMIEDQRAHFASTTPTASCARLPSSPPVEQTSLFRRPSDASPLHPASSSRREPPLHVSPLPSELQDNPMDSLASSLASASLAFVPKSVGAKKGKAGGKK